MALDIRTVVPARKAVQYDGTNGTEILAIFGLTPDSDDGQTLVWTIGGEDQTSASLGDWLVWSGTTVPGGGTSDAGFQSGYLDLTL